MKKNKLKIAVLATLLSVVLLFASLTVYAYFSTRVYVYTDSGKEVLHTGMQLQLLFDELDSSLNGTKIPIPNYEVRQKTENGATVNYIVYNDKDLDQVSNIDYDDIPASVILGNDVKIDGKNIKVASFYKDAGTTVIGLDYKGRGDIGVITLTFNNSPVELKQWTVIDPQSVEITLSLYGAQIDKPIDASLFKFKKDSGKFKLKKGR